VIAIVRRYIITAGDTSVSGTTNPPGASEFIPEVSGAVVLVVCVVFYEPSFVCLSFFFWQLYYLSYVLLLTIVLSLLCTTFDNCIISPMYYFWQLYYLSYVLLLDNCIISPMYYFWQLYYLSYVLLLTIVLSLLCTTFGYYSGIFKSENDKAMVIKKIPNTET
jgi:hypothetical protein